MPNLDVLTTGVEVESQLTDVQKDVATFGERYIAQQDVHRRLALTAPVAGTVVDLGVHTIGGVVKPGDRIMEIVPTSLHERTPLFLGSPDDVDECEQFIQGRHPALQVDRRMTSAVRAGS